MRRTSISFALLLFLIGCTVLDHTPVPPNTPIKSSSAAPTFTPDMCTGRQCTLTGVVFSEVIQPGSELEGAAVTLLQTSWCSPTKGQQQATTDVDGTFEFSVYVHDTDSFRLTVEMDGYELAQQLIGGFDCLYCHCPPIEIVSKAVE